MNEFNIVFDISLNLRCIYNYINGLFLLSGNFKNKYYQKMFFSLGSETSYSKFFIIGVINYFWKVFLLKDKRLWSTWRFKGCHLMFWLEGWNVDITLAVGLEIWLSSLECKSSSLLTADCWKFGVLRLFWSW